MFQPQLLTSVCLRPCLINWVYFWSYMSQKTTVIVHIIYIIAERISRIGLRALLLLDQPCCFSDYESIMTSGNVQIWHTGFCLGNWSQISQIYFSNLPKLTSPVFIFMVNRGTEEIVLMDNVKLMVSISIKPYVLCVSHIFKKINWVSNLCDLCRNYNLNIDLVRHKNLSMIKKQQ